MKSTIIIQISLLSELKVYKIKYNIYINGIKIRIYIGDLDNKANRNIILLNNHNEKRKRNLRPQTKLGNKKVDKTRTQA